MHPRAVLLLAALLLAPPPGAGREPEPRPEAGDPAGPRYLERTWSPHAGGLVRPHRLNYLQALRVTDQINDRPTSPSAGRSEPDPLQWNAREAKFQLSLKLEVAHLDLDVLGIQAATLWGAYTQQSNWQLYNYSRSRPFRETDHEPEAMLSLWAPGGVGGLRVLNLGAVHQSNGRSNPASRSWNRLYLQGGWEWGSLSVLARGWWRIPESAREDDNPDIERYTGYGDLSARWETRRFGAVSLLARHAVSSRIKRGFLQLDWSRVFRAPLAFHVQGTAGYGESLIDYNSPQSTLGVGLSIEP